MDSVHYRFVCAAAGLKDAFTHFEGLCVQFSTEELEAVCLSFSLLLLLFVCLFLRRDACPGVSEMGEDSCCL